MYIDFGILIGYIICFIVAVKIKSDSKIAWICGFFAMVLYLLEKYF